MDKRSAQIMTICQCIDHCFAYALWCDDFSQFLDPKDLIAGLDRGAEVMADATRLTSFLALRKLDDFLRATKPKPDDLIAPDFGLDLAAVLGDSRETLLEADERVKINKQAAHLTEKLMFDADNEVDLQFILERAQPVFERLLPALRAADTTGHASQWLDKTDALIKRQKQP